MTFRPTPQQEAIVHAPPVSLRISAGAGTGKTTTLAERVVAMVAGGQAEPEEILGITFTTKAADELADRIRTSLAGVADPGREVEVHTYHGFAAHLLREFGPLVGVERRTDVITPTFTRQMLGGIVARVPLPRLDVTYPGAVESIRSFGAGLADHLIDPTELAPPPALDPDDPWHARADLTTALCAYTEEKRRLGVADFGDLIRLAHRLMVEHPDVAAAVAARYGVVLLDEYQDTNPAQRELLRVIFAGRVPVTAVGDPDQTIYEWRGASLENFAAFPDHFPNPDGPAPTFPLSVNRRSGPEILAVANAVRARVSPFAAPLEPVPGAPPAAVYTAWLGTSVDEADWIAERLIALHQRGRPWSGMAVLFRKNKDMLAVHDALSRHGIPFEVANLGGLLSVPEVADLHAWLRVLHRPEDGPALVRLLTGARFRLGYGDLAHLARWVRARTRDTEADLDHEQVAEYSLVEALDRLDELEALRPAGRKALAQFAHEYRDLLEGAQGASLVELCRAILDRTGAWSDVEGMEPAAALSARLNLHRFLDLAEDWSPLEGRSSLTGFLGHLAAMGEDPAEELDTARLSDAEAVPLITVHRAKGLEWPVVFLPAAYRHNFPSRSFGFDDPFSRASSVPYELRLDRDSLPPIHSGMTADQRKELLRARHDDQEWRIAYVAVTRAKEELYMSGAYWYGHPEPTKKAAEPSPLFELVDRHQACVRLVRTEPVERPPTISYRTDLPAAPDPHFAGGWPEALRAALADPGWTERYAAELGVAPAYHRAVRGYQDQLFALPQPPAVETEADLTTSVTGLVVYAECPRRYNWSEIDRLPRRTSSAARRGIDVHRRIELHHRGVVPLDEVSPDLYDLPEAAEQPGVDPYRSFLSTRFAAARPHLVETPFQLRLTERVWVRGRIDAVYADGGSWEVVDFKTGSPKPDDHPIGVQLEAYAVAVDEVPFPGGPPTSVTVTFAHLVDPPEERSRRVTGEWLDRARGHLVELAEGISAESFEPTPSPACRSCDFLRFCPEGRAFVEAEG